MSNRGFDEYSFYGENNGPLGPTKKETVRIWIDDERAIGGNATILWDEPPYMDPFTKEFVSADLLDEAVKALELMRATYPYSPPCHGWEEQIEAHKAAVAVIAKLRSKT